MTDSIDLRKIEIAPDQIQSITELDQLDDILAKAWNIQLPTQASCSKAVPLKGLDRYDEKNFGLALKNLGQISQNPDFQANIDTFLKRNTLIRSDNMSQYLKNKGASDKNPNIFTPQEQKLFQNKFDLKTLCIRYNAAENIYKLFVEKSKQRDIAPPPLPPESEVTPVIVIPESTPPVIPEAPPPISIPETATADSYIIGVHDKIIGDTKNAKLAFYNKLHSQPRHSDAWFELYQVEKTGRNFNEKVASTNLSSNLYQPYLFLIESYRLGNNRAKNELIELPLPELIETQDNPDQLEDIPLPSTRLYRGVAWIARGNKAQADLELSKAINQVRYIFDIMALVPKRNDFTIKFRSMEALALYFKGSLYLEYLEYLENSEERRRAAFDYFANAVDCFLEVMELKQHNGFGDGINLHEITNDALQTLIDLYFKGENPQKQPVNEASFKSIILHAKLYVLLNEIHRDFLLKAFINASKRHKITLE